jgi:7-cyano-7-deazaguanine reductase
MTHYTDNLSQLGAQTAAPTSPETAVLERVPNPHADTLYLARFTAPEFTSLCPVTGQPDFATIRIRYVPDARCVELKSLKLYLWSFRDVGAYHEAVTNQILDDLVAATSPRFMEVEGDFWVRGGIHTVVIARHGQPR